MNNLFLSPQPLTEIHKLDGFSCGEPSLDDWLKRRARVNHINGASRTFVVVDANQCVIGYYALAAGAVTHQDALSAVRRNMPDPMPVMVLGRLAVDTRAQGIKLGAGLLQDAVVRVRAVSENVGVRVLLVHALNERAKKFYQKYGFQESPIHPMTLMLVLKKITLKTE
ncbi:GNAT family N-acetyltransferase [Candidatus Hamiltonella defensa]|uniref:GNAT family N-acetyltransferase n=1 Tax=Candidatus Williamhamiltonella defendens TaxID=138072 RepID=UPI001583C037|nr:GNAT family N-acetyltransferase [Candidatus Hamiltonella defensa]